MCPRRPDLPERKRLLSLFFDTKPPKSGSFIRRWTNLSAGSANDEVNGAAIGGAASHNGFYRSAIQRTDRRKRLRQQRHRFSPYRLTAAELWADGELMPASTWD